MPMSVSWGLVAFMTLTLVMSAVPHAARASQDAGARDPCAASRQVSVNPPAGSDAGPLSVDALDLIRTLSKQNDEFKATNAQLQDRVRKLTGEHARETQDLKEKVDELENGKGADLDTRGRPTWGALAVLVGLAFVVGMKVARQRDAERDQ